MKGYALAMNWFTKKTQLKKIGEDATSNWDDADLENFDIDLLTAQGRESLQFMTEVNVNLFEIDTADWGVDLDTGVITFTTSTAVITARVQVIGTYDTSTGTWMWGWDHPSIPPLSGISATIVKGIGAVHNIEELTTHKLRCSEDDAWGYTALASRLTGQTGSYRGTSWTTLIFMIFGPTTITSLRRSKRRET